MGCKMIAAITWTQLELKGLIQDEEAHVYFERAKRHLGLHPFHLTDLNAALREILSSTVNSYDSKINGIILSYKNPKLLTRMGTVLYDTCHIHVDIEADFYVFRPSVGDTLKGIVNKKSQDHVGILVHKTFNVSIPRPNNDKNWVGHSIQVGQEIRFTVTFLDFKGRLPYIRGSIDAEDYLRGCKLFDESFRGTEEKMEVKPKKTKFSFNDDGDIDEISGIDDVDRSLESSGVDEKISLKKSKKPKKEEIETEVEFVEKKHKNKKQVKVESKKLEEEEIETEVEYVEKKHKNKKQVKVESKKLEKEEIETEVEFVGKKHKNKKQVKVKVESKELDTEEIEPEVEFVEKKHKNKKQVKVELKELEKEEIEPEVEFMEKKHKNKKQVKVESKKLKKEEIETKVEFVEKKHKKKKQGLK